MTEKQLESFFTRSKFVKELKPTDFEQTNPTEPLYKGCCAILFYCPWCIHCVNTKSSWEKFGEITTFIKVCSMNCDKYSTYDAKVKSEYPDFLEGYPTIVFYNKGKPSKYYGNKNAEAFMSGCGEFCRKIK